MFCGDLCVGKTRIINKLLKNEKQNTYMSTTSRVIHKYQTEFEGQSFSVDIVDTQGTYMFTNIESNRKEEKSKTSVLGRSATLRSEGTIRPRSTMKMDTSALRLRSTTGLIPNQEKDMDAHINLFLDSLSLNFSDNSDNSLLLQMISSSSTPSSPSSGNSSASSSPRSSPSFPSKSSPILSSGFFFFLLILF